MAASLAALLAAGLGAPLTLEATAAAQSAPLGETGGTTRKGEREIAFDAASWRALVEGKTLHYASEDGAEGREHHYPGGRRFAYMFEDGDCIEGVWSEANGVFCYEAVERHCYRQFRRGDAIVVRHVEQGWEAWIAQITDEPLGCAPAPVSARPAKFARDASVDG